MGLPHRTRLAPAPQIASLLPVPVFPLAQQRLGQHHHAGAATVRSVIHPSVGVLCEVSQGPQAHLHLAGSKGTPRDAVHHVRSEQLREERDDVKAHGDVVRGLVVQTPVHRDQTLRQIHPGHIRCHERNEALRRCGNRGSVR